MKETKFLKFLRENRKEVIELRKQIFLMNVFKKTSRNCEVCHRKYYYYNGLYQCVCGCVD